MPMKNPVFLALIALITVLLAVTGDGGRQLKLYPSVSETIR
jgi:hypothetical protein